MKRLQVVVPGRWWLGLILWAALPSVTWAQESASLSGLRPYDNFSGALIDPSKWVGQWQCGSTVMECMREIQDRQLHLRVRGYGDATTNGGAQYGVSELYLKAGAAVTNLAARVTVRRAAGDSCPTGTPVDSFAGAVLWGSFFAGADGTPFNDVVAAVYVANAPGSTDVLNVSAYLASGSQTLDSLFLGQVNLGERVTLNLVWDQPNHRFITRLFRPASNTLVERYMPYTVSDAMPPASPQRALSARAQPVNCLGRRTVADMDVLFDNVMTN